MDGRNGMHRNVKCLIAGGCAGVLNGLFGAGGGLILVPLLSRWIGLEEKPSFATSIAIILPLSIVSYSLFYLQGGRVWKDALPYLLGGILGGILATHIFNNISIKWLHRLFSLLLFYGGIRAVLLL